MIKEKKHDEQLSFQKNTLKCLTFVKTIEKQPREY
jgi:hypothetical protein